STPVSMVWAETKVTQSGSASGLLILRSSAAVTSRGVGGLDRASKYIPAPTAVTIPPMTSPSTRKTHFRTWYLRRASGATAASTSREMLAASPTWLVMPHTGQRVSLSSKTV